MALLNGWFRMFGRTFLFTYIDAGTGSLIIQIIIGSAAGILLALKMTWKRLKNWVKHNHFDKEKVNESQVHLNEQ